MENKWIKEWKEWCRHPKPPNRTQLFAVFLVGVLLLVIVWPTPQEEEDTKEEERNVQAESRSGGEQYQEYLERRVADALEQVEGVGRTQVVITLKSTAEKVVEKDTSSNSQTIDETDSAGGRRISQESVFEDSSIYEQYADGTQSPYVSKELTPEIEGVLVVAEGGDNAVVIQDITEAIQALFGVEAHKIKIMKRTDT